VTFADVAPPFFFLVANSDDLLPNIPISCLPSCCMDPKVLRLNILINCSQPGGSWSSSGSPVCWWS